MTTLREWLEEMDETVEDPGPYLCELCGCVWWPELDDECPACP